MTIIWLAVEAQGTCRKGMRPCVLVERPVAMVEFNPIPHVGRPPQRKGLGYRQRTQFALRRADRVNIGQKGLMQSHGPAK